jgi:hypothetical protein
MTFNSFPASPVLALSILFATDDPRGRRILIYVILILLAVSHQQAAATIGLIFYFFEIGGFHPCLLTGWFSL